MSKKAATHCLPPTAQAARDGYTLMEVLIVGVLLSVLMLSVWSLFRSWSGLYDRGQRRTEQAQLVRSLCDQFTDDLHCVTYSAPPPSRGRSSSSRRTSGSGNLALTGASDWLILDVLQPANPFHEPLSPDEMPAVEFERPLVHAPELQRIIYTFQPAPTDPFQDPAGLDGSFSDDTVPVEVTSPLSGDGSEIEPFFGLLRVVVAREYFDHLAAADSSAYRRPGIVMTDQATGDLSGGELPGVLEQDKVPEVSWMEFRYYDGYSWVGSWDSRSQGQLPVAVEIRFELVEIDPTDAEVSTDDDTEFVGDDNLALPQDDRMYPADEPSSWTDDAAIGIGGAYEEPTYHRCVVYLDPAKKN